MFCLCLLVVLAKLSLLAKWLARKTPLRKPNRGEGIVPRKPRPKSVHGFLGLLYCFIVLLCIYVVSCPYVIYYPTIMARYCLFVLKMTLNPKQTNRLRVWFSFFFQGTHLQSVQKNFVTRFHTPGSVGLGRQKIFMHGTWISDDADVDAEDVFPWRR